MDRHTDFVQDASGRAIPGATITVYLEDGVTKATIYKDRAGTQLKDNPFQSSVDGGFYFSAADGVYVLSIYKAGYIDQRIEVELIDPDTVAEQVAEATARAADAQQASAEAAASALQAQQDVAQVYADYAAPDGASRMGFQQSSTGAIEQTVDEALKHLPLRDQYDTEQHHEDAVDAIGTPQLADTQTKFVQSGTDPAAQTVRGKLRRIKELGDRENVDDTGTTSILTQFKNAVADVAAGGRLIVRRGRYKFTITGDSDSILLPSEFMLDCEEGVVFEWDYLGSPLFVVVNEEDVLIQGPMFEWDGTLAEVSGTASSRFGWNHALPNRDFCAHILALGSHGVRAKHAGCRAKGDNPSQATDAFYQFASFHHADDGSTRAKDNAVEDIRMDDVVIGSLVSGQDNFSFRKIVSRRYPGQHPVGSGLAGHLLYATDNGGTLTSRGMQVKDITDHGGTYGTITSRGDTSIQLKSVEDGMLDGLMSKRPGGMFSGGEIVGGVYANMTWRPASAESNGISAASAVNGKYVEDAVFRGLSFYLPDNSDKSAWNATFNRCSIEAYINAAHTGAAINSSIMNGGGDNRVNIDYVARNSTTSIPCKLTGNTVRNIIDITPLGATTKVRPSADAGCEDNVVRIKDTPLHVWGNNWTETEADLTVNGFDPIRRSKVFRIAGGTQSNPSTTFTLPREGVWVGVVQLLRSNGADIRGGLYRIVWDTGSLQSVELLGSAWTVGSNAPSALSLAVSSAGVVTVTSTAGSFDWDLQFDLECRGNNRYADY